MFIICAYVNCNKKWMEVGVCWNMCASYENKDKRPTKKKNIGVSAIPYPSEIFLAPSLALALSLSHLAKLFHFRKLWHDSLACLCDYYLLGGFGSNNAKKMRAGFWRLSIHMWSVSKRDLVFFVMMVPHMTHDTHTSLN